MPFAGPVGAVVVGLVDGEYVINPTLEQREKSEMYVTVAGTKEKVVMIEAGANEVKEDVMFNAIVYAHEEIKKICEFIDGIVAEVGKEKEPYEAHEVDKITCASLRKPSGPHFTTTQRYNEPKSIDRPEGKLLKIASPITGR